MGTVKKVIIGKRAEIAIRYDYNRKPVFFNTGRTIEEDEENEGKVTEVYAEVLNAINEIMSKKEQPTAERVHKEFHRPKVSSSLGFSQQLDLSDLIWNFHNEAERSESTQEKYSPKTIKYVFDLVNEFQEDTGVYLEPFENPAITTYKTYIDNLVYWLLVVKRIETQDYWSIMYTISRALRFNCANWNPDFKEKSTLFRRYEIPPYISNGYFKYDKLMEIVNGQLDVNPSYNYFLLTLASQCVIGDANFSMVDFGMAQADGKWKYFALPVEYQYPENNNRNDAPGILREFYKLQDQLLIANRDLQDLMEGTGIETHLLESDTLQTDYYPKAMRKAGFDEAIGLIPAIKQAQSLIVPMYKTVNDQFILQSHIEMMMKLGYEPMLIQRDVRADYAKDPHRVFMALIASYNAGLATSESAFQYRVPMVQVSE